MIQSFNLSGVCANKIDIEVKNDIIVSVKFDSGCPGNLVGISRMVIGKKLDEVIDLFEGITCGSKSTSCPDQLAKSLKTMSISEACCV